jgi:hypothetical protein
MNREMSIRHDFGATGPDPRITPCDLHTKRDIRTGVKSPTSPEPAPGLLPLRHKRQMIMWLPSMNGTWDGN